MPLSVVSNVTLNANSANSRGAARRRSPVPPPRTAASASADDPFVQAPEFERDEAPSSSASLSILAHALAAYSQN